jgi:hypothetical protein
VSSCEHGYELSGSVKCWEILEELSERLAASQGLGSMELIGRLINF